LRKLLRESNSSMHDALGFEMEDSVSICGGSEMEENVGMFLILIHFLHSNRMLCKREPCLIIIIIIY